MRYIKENICLPFEKMISFLLKNHIELQLSSLEILLLAHGMEGIRSLPEFNMKIPDIRIGISSKTNENVIEHILLINKSEISVTIEGAEFTVGVGYDCFSRELFTITSENIAEFNWYENNIELSIDEFIDWIDMDEPNVKITSTDFGTNAGLSPVGLQIKKEEESEMEAEQLITDIENAAKEKGVIPVTDKRNFLPDYGMFVNKTFKGRIAMHFYSLGIKDIIRIGVNNYSIFTSYTFDKLGYALSLDFDATLLPVLFQLLNPFFDTNTLTIMWEKLSDPAIKEKLIEWDRPIESIGCECYLSEDIVVNENETYIPFVVKKFF